MTIGKLKQFIKDENLSDDVEIDLAAFQGKFDPNFICLVLDNDGVETLSLYPSDEFGLIYLDNFKLTLK